MAYTAAAHILSFAALAHGGVWEGYKETFRKPNPEGSGPCASSRKHSYSIASQHTDFTQRASG